MPIPKYQEDRDQWEVDDFVSFARTGTPPLNPDWLERKESAMRDADLEPDDDAPKAVADMSPADHVRRKYGDAR